MERIGGRNYEVIRDKMKHQLTNHDQSPDLDWLLTSAWLESGLWISSFQPLSCPFAGGRAPGLLGGGPARGPRITTD